MPMIDIDWLKDHVEVPEGLTYEQLAKDLVKVGLEEEEIHSSQVTGPIVVGYVVDATVAPANCPVCRHPQGYFIRAELTPFRGESIR